MNKFNNFILATIFVVYGTISVFAGQDEQNGNAYLRRPSYLTW